MTTATLTHRLDRSGFPIRRVVVPARREDVAARIDRRLQSLAEIETLAWFGFILAVCFATGVLAHDLAPFVGWGRAFTDAVTLVVLVVIVVPVARLVAPHVTRGLHTVRDLDRSFSWWIGMSWPRRDGWLPPLPWWPTGTFAVIPYHGAITEDGVIVRRTRLARHVDWVMVYNHHSIIAVARVTGQTRNHPGVIARRFGPQTGLTATAYRAYLDGHKRAYAIHTDLAYTLTRPITLAEVGITGPLGSHRYIGGGA